MTQDTLDLPPRPEEEMAAAEQYRVLQGAQPSHFSIHTATDIEYLTCIDGEVRGFETWHTPVSPEIAQEISREVRTVCPTCQP